jgi:hypothetical protein
LDTQGWSYVSRKNATVLTNNNNNNNDNKETKMHKNIYFERRGDTKSIITCLFSPGIVGVMPRKNGLFLCIFVFRCDQKIKKLKKAVKGTKKVSRKTKVYMFRLEKWHYYAK